MDEAAIRDHVQQHADSVKRGDIEAITEDFAEALRPQVPQIAQLLPRPVNEAEVLSVDVGDPTSIAMIRYTGGDDDSVTIRSSWEDVDGRPRIVAGEPVS